MSTPRPIDPKRLLGQTAWVRRLALSLARDESSADDIVQETMAAALRRPPQDIDEDAGLRAWIATVVRNFAFRHSRETRRRELREQLASVPESSDAEERARSLEELRAELFAHVIALPADEREIALLRYFEELDSAQIARRLGVPDSTVRNRLRRALAELRERMKREHGSNWRDLCLFVLPNTNATVAAGSGAIAAAGGGLWIAGGGAALALLALAWILRAGETGPERGPGSFAAVPIEIPSTTDASETAAHSGSSFGSKAEADQLRISEAGALHIRVSEVLEPPPTTPFAHGIIVHGVVRDENGESLENVGVGWTDRWGNEHGGRTSEGKYSIHSLTPGPQVVRLSGHACGELLREVTLVPDQEQQEFDFVVSRTHVVPVYLFDSDGSNLLETVAGGHPPLPAGCGMAVATHVSPPARVRLSFGPDEYHPDWTALLQSWEIGQRLPEGALGLLEISGAAPYFVSLVHMDTVLETQRFETIPESVTFRADRSRFEHARGSQPVVTRTYSVSDFDASRDPFRHRNLPRSGAGPRVHLQFLDESARPVMARFDFKQVEGEIPGWASTPRGMIRLGASWTAHVNGTFDTDILEPGRYVLQVSGTADDDDPTFKPVGALPRRFEVPDGEATTELVVLMSPLHEVLLRSDCNASEWFRWELSTVDGIALRKGILIGRAAKSMHLPAGKFSLRVCTQNESAVAAEVKFESAEKPLVLELTR